MVTYHPQFNDLGEIITKNFIYSHAEKQLKEVFTLAPVVSFLSSFSFRSHLGRAKVYPLLRTKGSSCCGKSRCEPVLIKRKKILLLLMKKTSFVTEINHHNHFHSNCFIYLLSCKVHGLKYVGSTVDKFHLRWNNYKSSPRVALKGGNQKDNYFHQKFWSEDYHMIIWRLQNNVYS